LRTKTYDGNIDAERHECTNPPVKRPIAALDAGNRTTQWVDPANVVRTIPSCIKMLEDWEEAQPDSGSVLIEVLTNSGEIQERFIIGEEAQRQKGVSAFTGNKCEMAKRLVYAALEPIPGTNTVIFDYLRVALPDARNVENVGLLKALAATYFFRRNGETVHASVREVECVDETRPAYKFAVSTKLFKSQSTLTEFWIWVVAQESDASTLPAVT
jgi:hypothetical protein